MSLSSQPLPTYGRAGEPLTTTIETVPNLKSIRRVADFQVGDVLEVHPGAPQQESERSRQDYELGIGGLVPIHKPRLRPIFFGRLVQVPAKHLGQGEVYLIDVATGQMYELGPGSEAAGWRAILMSGIEKIIIRE